MDIIIGKSDIAALGCEGCKKKFVCNIANNDPANRAYIEGALGVNIPEKDPPAIIDNSGGEGEKGLADHANLRRSELGSLLLGDGGNEHAYDCLHA